MKADQVQKELKTIYDEWRVFLQLQAIGASQLSPPLLLSVSESYTSAKRRILFVGQETYGWDWTKDLQIKYPEYPNAYPYDDMITMQDFAEKVDSVDALCWGYREFNFACHQPKTKRSPFWKAFRDVQKWPDAGLIWNNLSRCDYDNGSILNCPLELRDSLIDMQKDLFTKELEILRPSVWYIFYRSQL